MKIPQANATLERIYGVVGNVMRTTSLDISSTITDSMIPDFVINVAWVIHSTYHTILKSTSGATIFGRDVLFGIPYIAGWNDIGRRRQEKVNKGNDCKKT